VNADSTITDHFETSGHAALVNDNQGHDVDDLLRKILKIRMNASTKIEFERNCRRDGFLEKVRQGSEEGF